MGERAHITVDHRALELPHSVYCNLRFHRILFLVESDSGMEVELFSKRSYTTIRYAIRFVSLPAYSRYPQAVCSHSSDRRPTQTPFDRAAFKGLGEIPAIAEKPLMGLRLPASIIVLGNAQNRACVVRHLEKSAGIRIDVPIVCDVLREHKIQRIKQRRADSALPIVVIHGDGIEGMEIRQVIEDEQSEIPPQPRFELASVMDGRAVVP